MVFNAKQAIFSYLRGRGILRMDNVATENIDNLIEIDKAPLY